MASDGVKPTPENLPIYPRCNELKTRAPSLFQSSFSLPSLLRPFHRFIATPSTASIRPLLSFSVSEATSVWQLHEIRGWNSLDAHCPAAAYEAEPVTIDERGGGGRGWPRLDCPLIYGNCNSHTTTRHRVAPRPLNYRRKHSRAPLLLLHCTTIPSSPPLLPPARWRERPLFTRQARWARERTPRA